MNTDTFPIATINDRDHERARALAANWARNLLQRSFALLDTETTDLNSDGEVVQIALVEYKPTESLISMQHHVLLHTYIKPSVEINEKSRAFEVSGISNKMVQNAPSFEPIWSQYSALIGTRPIVAYNAMFDQRLVKQSIERQMPVGFRYQEPHTWIDVMIPYSTFVGQWNSKYGNYRWQKLPGTEHGALADCLACLAVLRSMASAAEMVQKTF